MLKMQFLTIALCLLAAKVALCYDEKYDKIDVDKIIKDDALFMSYINCFLDKGPCTAEYSSDFKDMLKEVMSDACGKCSKLQKENFRKILKEIIENKKALLSELKNKFDPNDEYVDNVKKILDEN